MLKHGHLESEGTSPLTPQQQGEDGAPGQGVFLQDLRIIRPLRASCCLLPVFGLNTPYKNLKGEFIYGEDVTNAVWKQRSNQL